MPAETDFRMIYDQYFSRIHAYLIKLIGPYHAEDAAQEVFNKASRHMETLKDPSKISNWLYRIATHTAIDKTRSRAYRDFKAKEGTDQDPQVRDQNVWTRKKGDHSDQKLIKEEMRSCVREFIHRLPDTYRSILILKDYEFKTDKEIAAIMDISVSTVKIRYHRAKKHLKKELDAGCDFFYDEDNRLQCDRKAVSGILDKPVEP